MGIVKFLNEKLELSICIALISAMTLIIAVQVFMRYVMRDSLSWSEELARYIFIWLIYIGISYGALIMKHIKIDAALGLFPRSARPYIVILGDILFFGFAVFICYSSYKIVMRQVVIGQQSPAMHIPMWFIYAAPMVGFGMAAVRQAQTILFRVRCLKEEQHG